MTSSTVKEGTLQHPRLASTQRFTRQHPCPVCGGHGTIKPGRHERCYGFLSGDGAYAHCTRPEFARNLTLSSGSSTYAHRLDDACRCGVRHTANGAAKPERSPAPRKADRQARSLALELWEKSLPAEGTLIETYLRSRGLKGAIPASVRFLPSHLHTESGAYLPVMLSAVTLWPSAEPVAVHRTYLLPNGEGKAAVVPAKKCLGPTGGGAVRLAEATDRLAVGEGIETCWAVSQTSGWPAWSALSASGFESLVLPELPLAGEILLAADNDAAGLRSAFRAAGLWLAQGRRVRLAIPPRGRDFNDLLWCDL